jgi:hypothetical protein
MKNGQSRETGSKTQDEDTQSKIHNTILDTTMHKMKIKKKIICVGHLLAQDVDKLSNKNKKTTKKTTICVGHHY